MSLVFGLDGKKSRKSVMARDPAFLDSTWSNFLYGWSCFAKKISKLLRANVKKEEEHLGPRFVTKG